MFPGREVQAQLFQYAQSELEGILTDAVRSGIGGCVALERLGDDLARVIRAQLNPRVADREAPGCQLHRPIVDPVLPRIALQLVAR